MDPEAITQPIWHDISTMLRFLWAYLFFIIGFAFNLLIAHALIPSLSSTGHLSPRIARLRPLFYLGALSILVIAVLFFALTVLHADVIRRFYARWWI